MFGKFFDTSAVDAFAAWVVAELSKALPPDRLDEAREGDKLRERIRDRISERAQSLVAANRLNIYQKAKLGERLEEALETAGYPRAFSKPFAYDVVRVVALASAARR